MTIIVRKHNSYTHKHKILMSGHIYIQISLLLVVIYIVYTYRLIHIHVNENVQTGLYRDNYVKVISFGTPGHLTRQVIHYLVSTIAVTSSCQHFNDDI